MRTHLRESMLALLLIGILATGCDTGTKKASENSITFDSISVEKTYHLLDNPDNPNCNLEIKFVYPRKYSDKEVLKNLQRQFVSSYFGENYEQLSLLRTRKNVLDVSFRCMLTNVWNWIKYIQEISQQQSVSNSPQLVIQSVMTSTR